MRVFILILKRFSVIVKIQNALFLNIFHAELNHTNPKGIQYMFND